MAHDWTKLYKKYRGLWVALGADEETVLAADRVARVAFAKAVKAGHPRPILARIPEDAAAYVGAV